MVFETAEPAGTTCLALTWNFTVLHAVWYVITSPALSWFRCTK